MSWDSLVRQRDFFWTRNKHNSALSRSMHESFASTLFIKQRVSITLTRRCIGEPADNGNFFLPSFPRWNADDISGKERKRGERIIYLKGFFLLPKTIFSAFVKRSAQIARNKDDIRG